MTPEQKELDRNAFRALIDLNLAIEWHGDDATNYLTEKLRAVRSVLMALHQGWRRHLGEPVEVKPAVIARELRQLADRIETEEHDENHS